MEIYGHRYKYYRREYFMKDTPESQLIVKITIKEKYTAVTL